MELRWVLDVLTGRDDIDSPDLSMYFYIHYTVFSHSDVLACARLFFDMSEMLWDSTGKCVTYC